MSRHGAVRGAADRIARALDRELAALPADDHEDLLDSVAEAVEARRPADDEDDDDADEDEDDEGEGGDEESDAEDGEEGGDPW